MRTATRISDVELPKACLDEAWKLLSKGPMEEFIQYVKKLNQTSSAMGQDTVNCSTLILEAKGGLRLALISITSYNSFDKSASAQAMKRCHKHIDRAIRSGASAWVQPME